MLTFRHVVCVILILTNLLAGIAIIVRLRTHLTAKHSKNF